MNKEGYTKTAEKDKVWLYLTEYEDEEITQLPSVTLWSLGYCISLTCDSDESALALFEGLQHVTDIDAD